MKNPTTNKGIINAFLNQEEIEINRLGLNMSEGILYSYSTPIATRVITNEQGVVFHLNCNKESMPSRTSSKHYNDLYREIQRRRLFSVHSNPKNWRGFKPR